MTPRQLSWGDRIVAVADWQCPVSLWEKGDWKYEKAFRSTFLENPLKGYERTFKPSSNLRWKKTNGHNWGRNPAFYASINMDRTRLGILGLHTPWLSMFTIQEYPFWWILPYSSIGSCWVDEVNQILCTAFICAYCTWCLPVLGSMISSTCSRMQPYITSHIDTM